MASGILYTVNAKYSVPYNGHTYIDRLNNVAIGSSSYLGLPRLAEPPSLEDGGPDSR